VETLDETPRRPSSTRRAGPGWPFTILAVLVCLVLLLVLAGRFSLVPGLNDLFGEETKDRSGPALLESIQDMSRHEGAVGTFQIVVDLEKDAKYLPDAVRGTRTLYVAAGTVGAYVDLGRTGPESVVVDEERTSVTLHLPRAALGAPALDPDRSYAVSKQRGLLDRLGDLFSDNPADERAVHRLASERIAEAAEESGLVARAEKNTTSMLEGLLRSLGFRTVRVVYA
jgi:hypothetical protein